MSKDISKILFEDLALIIEQGKKQLTIQVNSTLTMVYWQVGHRINKDILENERAAYGQEVVVMVAEGLEKKYGRQFNVKNVRRMMRFASTFTDFNIVPPMAAQLSWSHFI